MILRKQNRNQAPYRDTCRIRRHLFNQKTLIDRWQIPIMRHLREVVLIKLYWKQIHEETKLRILISEYVHLKKLDVLENWVKMHQVRELEEELVKRGVIWDRNCDLLGSQSIFTSSLQLYMWILISALTMRSLAPCSYSWTNPRPVMMRKQFEDPGRSCHLCQTQA